MLELIFIILFFMIFGKLLLFAWKAAWGIAKILVTIVFLPITLLLMVVGGLTAIALPILLVVGVVSMLVTRK